MAKKSLGMKYITRLGNGYWVRKTFNYGTEKQYFSFKAHGGVIFALLAAKAYRDNLVAKYETMFSVKTKHPHNKTGVVGLNWCCRLNPSRLPSVIHTFRVQAPTKMEDLNKIETTFSIKKEGLWKAYRMAVIWRQERVGSLGMPSSMEEIQSAFMGFMRYYISVINEEVDVRVRQEMTLAICKLLEDKGVPMEIKQFVIANWVPMAEVS